MTLHVASHQLPSAVQDAVQTTSKLQHWTETPSCRMGNSTGGDRLAVFAVALWSIYRNAFRLIHMFAKTPEVPDFKSVVMVGSIFEGSCQFPIALMVPAQRPDIRAAVNQVLAENHG